MKKKQILPKILFVLIWMNASVYSVFGQNVLNIPVLLDGPNFDLQVQEGITEFFPDIDTPTFGINGNILGPTLLLNKGETVTLNVTNNLETTTTMHWHGLHVASMNDGGPHQIIEEGATWSPQFEVMNNAGTFWYHPHGEAKTDLQVSRGLAGLIIVKDQLEASLELPRTYGVDDFPIIVQTKSFDILNQIQISTQADTSVMVNATVDPYLQIPSQVVRLRLLDGSSERSYLFGFSNNMIFHQIATDGGLLEEPFETTRLRLSPGERAEILVDFSSMQGETVYLMSYSSELPNGILGADDVGFGLAEIPGYENNPLNGIDFNILQLDVAEQTSNPVLTIPDVLVEIQPWALEDIDVERTFSFQPLSMDMQSMVQGPFGINGYQFDMEVINEVVLLNSTELWTLNNQTQVAHPFHIHDVEFLIVDYNGDNPPPDQSGFKDVVLVPPMGSISFITKFEDFADPMTPYMFHCHLLHHEDEGMMGSFTVVDPNGIDDISEEREINIYPNPVNSVLTLLLEKDVDTISGIEVFNSFGQRIEVPIDLIGNKAFVNVKDLSNGFYTCIMNERIIGVFIRN
jgi:blue copper oxidase